MCGSSPVPATCWPPAPTACFRCVTRTFVRCRIQRVRDLDFHSRTDPRSPMAFSRSDAEASTVAISNLAPSLEHLSIHSAIAAGPSMPKSSADHHCLRLKNLCRQSKFSSGGSDDNPGPGLYAAVFLAHASNTARRSTYPYQSRSTCRRPVRPGGASLPSFEPTDAPDDILDDPIRMLTRKVETLYHNRDFSPTILRYSGEAWRSFAHSSMSGARFRVRAKSTFLQKFPYLT
jgi:hypothetical protein